MTSTLKKHLDDDPITDVSASGTTITHMDDDLDDPVSDIDLTGKSISSLTQDDYNYTGCAIDALSESDNELSLNISFSTISYRDPLGDVEIGDSDDTGICMGYVDYVEGDDLDPITETNASASSLRFVED